MKQVMVRYKVKKNRVAEHEKLLRAVFDELGQTAPEGLRYAAFRMPDGASFVHVALVDGRKNPLTASKAFAAFTSEIEERCDEPPQPADLAMIGSYSF